MSQYGRSDSYRVATTQDKDEKESPKKKGGKDLDDLKKEVPIVSSLHPASFDLTAQWNLAISHRNAPISPLKSKLNFSDVLKKS